ncbi:MAG: RDD family protein [Holophagaceae bacterium]
MSGLRYGGFWLRAWAFLLDALVLLPLVWLARFAAGVAYEELLSRTVLDAAGEAFSRYQALHGLARDLLGLGLPWLYFAVLEGFGGASLGKRIAGLRVRDAEGRPIGPLRSAWRNLVKPLSLGCCCGGLLLAAWTARKRALHDWLSGTVVVREGSVPAGPA